MLTLVEGHKLVLLHPLQFESIDLGTGGTL